MNTRFYNCRILPMADNTDCFDGEVWVVGNKIDFVGTKEEAKERKSIHLTGIDCKGNLLMPGFKSAYTFCDDISPLICR